MPYKGGRKSRPSCHTPFQHTICTNILFLAIYPPWRRILLDDVSSSPVILCGYDYAKILENHGLLVVLQKYVFAKLKRTEEIPSSCNARKIPQYMGEAVGAVFVKSVY